MSNLTFTIYIEQTLAGSFCAYLKQMPHLMRVEGTNFLEVYRDVCCQTATLIQERADLKDIQIRTEVSATIRARFKEYHKGNRFAAD
jgi:hypothetical protein